MNGSTDSLAILKGRLDHLRHIADDVTGKVPA